MSEQRERDRERESEREREKLREREIDYLRGQTVWKVIYYE